MPIKLGWCPPRSPYSLIQEDLFPDEWAILVACVMLNCTQRRQVERVLPTFLSLWPTARALSDADVADVSALVTPLGFGNRRAVTLIGLSRDYLRPGWVDSRDLLGVGQYAGRAHDIFCRGIIGDEPPRDHALVRYWEWLGKKTRALTRVGAHGAGS